MISLPIHLFKEKTTNFFDTNSDYVLFSGTGKNGNGPFRHLNDLFLMLFLLIHKKIPSDKIYLAIDKEIITYLDKRTAYKKVVLFGNSPLTYKEIIEKYIDEKNIIEVADFENNFHRRKNDLIFIASGHGAINGLSIDTEDGVEDKFLSSDYFEKISDKKRRTILIMSQCQAAAFHHLDTRKNICVLGASDYQSSVSLSLRAMIDNNDFVNTFSFENDIAINPFIFSLFILLLDVDNSIHNEKKTLINLFKYVASSTLSYLAQSGKRKLRISKTQIEQLQGDSFEFTIDERILVQQPFLLNKILAARINIS